MVTYPKKIKVEFEFNLDEAFRAELLLACYQLLHFPDINPDDCLVLMNNFNFLLDFIAEAAPSIGGSPYYEEEPNSELLYRIIEYQTQRSTKI